MSCVSVPSAACFSTPTAEDASLLPARPLGKQASESHLSFPAQVSSHTQPSLKLLWVCAGCHNTTVVGKGVREYLHHEWERKVRPPCFAVCPVQHVCLSCSRSLAVQALGKRAAWRDSLCQVCPCCLIIWGPQKAAQAFMPALADGIGACSLLLRRFCWQHATSSTPALTCRHLGWAAAWAGRQRH